MKEKEKITVSATIDAGIEKGMEVLDRTQAYH